MERMVQEPWRNFDLCRSLHMFYQTYSKENNQRKTGVDQWYRGDLLLCGLRTLPRVLAELLYREKEALYTQNFCRIHTRSKFEQTSYPDGRAEEVVSHDARENEQKMAYKVGYKNLQGPTPAKKPICIKSVKL